MTITVYANGTDLDDWAKRWPGSALHGGLSVAIEVQDNGDIIGCETVGDAQADPLSDGEARGLVDYALSMYQDARTHADAVANRREYE